MANIGKNTPNSAALQNYVERLENLASQKKAIGDAEKAVMAEVVSSGLSPRGIRYVLKVRKMKPHDRQEAETERDIYLHAMGMDNEPPLFRQLQTAVKDPLSRDQVIDGFKMMVPHNGEVIVKIGKERLRLWRDKDGEAQVEDYIDAPAPRQNASRSTLPPAPKKEVPNCSEDDAETLGRAAAKENKPVIDNPFPFDDARRPRWDLGWRKEAGSDGMGPKK